MVMAVSDSTQQANILNHEHCVHTDKMLDALQTLETRLSEAYQHLEKAMNVHVCEQHDVNQRLIERVHALENKENELKTQGEILAHRVQRTKLLECARLHAAHGDYSISERNVKEERCTSAHDGECSPIVFLIGGKTFARYGVPGQHCDSSFIADSSRSPASVAAVSDQSETYIICPMCSVSFLTTEESFSRHLANHFDDK